MVILNYLEFFNQHQYSIIMDDVMGFSFIKLYNNNNFKLKKI